MDLRFPFVAFAAVTNGCAKQLALLLMHNGTRFEARLLEHSHRLALEYLQATVVSVALLWLVIATS